MQYLCVDLFGPAGGPWIKKTSVVGFFLVWEVCMPSAMLHQVVQAAEM